MSFSLSQLNDKQRGMIVNREELGKEAETFADAQKRCEARNEKDLQRQIANLLRLRGIEVNVSRMDKRKTDKVGWPDLTFAVCGWAPGIGTRVYACAWEVKLPGAHLSGDQRAMRTRLQQSPNNWTHRTITSVDQAREELKNMGIE